MNDPSPSLSGAAQSEVCLPCQESCASFRPLDPERWPGFGLCQNRSSPLCGYPVHIGRECRHFRVQLLGAATRAS